MATIDLKLKTYDQLAFEITRLNTDKYLLEQKLQQKENIIKEAIEYIEDNSDDMHTYISQAITQILKGSEKE